MPLSSPTRKRLRRSEEPRSLQTPQTCESPAAILTVFRTAPFGTAGDFMLTGWPLSTLNVLCAFSDALGEGVNSVIIISFLPP
jgi:hypothetical protein